MALTRRFEVEIRDAATHYSNTIADDPETNVLLDDLHPNVEHEVETIRYYIEDDHDIGYDLSVQHTYADDEDYTAAATAATHSLSGGDATATGTVPGPVGRLRLLYKTGALTTALSSGSCTVVFMFTDDGTIA